MGGGEVMARQHLPRFQFCYTFGDIELILCLRNDQQRDAVIHGFARAVHAAMRDEEVGALEDLQLGDEFSRDEVGGDRPQVIERDIVSDRHHHLVPAFSKYFHARAEECQVIGEKCSQGDIDEWTPRQLIKRKVWCLRARKDRWPDKFDTTVEGVGERVKEF